MTEEEKAFYKSLSEMIVNAKEVFCKSLDEVFPKEARENLADFLAKFAEQIKEYNEAAEKLTDEEAEASLTKYLGKFTKEAFEEEFTGKDATRQGFKVWVTHSITHNILTAILCEKHKKLRDKLPGMIEAHVDAIYPLMGKFSYTPPERHNFPNDKVSKEIRKKGFEGDGQGVLDVVEREANKKKKITEAVTKVAYSLEKLRELGYKNPTPFDFYVVYTAFSIQQAGNDVTTIPALYRAMTGKGEKDRAPSEEMQEAIEDSLIKGMNVVLAVGPDGIKRAYAKTIKKADRIGAMLPIEIGPAEINGVEVERVVKFLGKSPLLRVAEVKGGQFATYDTTLLNVPYNVSKQNMLIAPFLLWHIEDTRSGHVRKTIIIDNLIQETGFTGERSRFVGFVIKCFDYWKKVKYIKSYEIEKDGRGKAVRIKFTLTKKTEELQEG